MSARLLKPGSGEHPSGPDRGSPSAPTLLEQSADAALSGAGATPLRPASIRLLTLNMHKGFTSFNRRYVLRELRDAIHAVDADVVFLQEVLGDDATARPAGVAWHAQPQYEFLADTLWPHFSYGRNAVYPEGHHGNALLSRFPIAAFDNIDISVDGPQEPRGLLHCRLRLPGHDDDVHALCVHLGLDARQRQQQLQASCALMNRLPTRAPLILAGDFNDWRQTASAQLGRHAALDEVFERSTGRSARTWPALLPLLRLDRIYYRNFQPVSCRVLGRSPWSRLSDHVGLFAELRL